MSRYIVRVIGPSGRQTFLRWGRECEQQDNATHYPHPSNAQVAADGYLRKTPGVYAEVVDTRDPERGPVAVTERGPNRRRAA